MITRGREAENGSFRLVAGRTLAAITFPCRPSNWPMIWCLSLSTLYMSRESSKATRRTLSADAVASSPPEVRVSKAMKSLEVDFRLVLLEWKAPVSESLVP